MPCSPNLSPMLNDAWFNQSVVSFAFAGESDPARGAT
jgi:hypothetical protein